MWNNDNNRGEKRRLPSVVQGGFPPYSKEASLRVERRDTSPNPSERGEQTRRSAFFGSISPLSRRGAGGEVILVSNNYKIINKNIK
jgi:hypothetical protein